VTTLQAFDADQFSVAQRLLALKVAQMMGRKLEEGDWSEVYCAAKGIDVPGWSNLDIDVVAGNLGVEHKMLRYKSVEIEEACGTTQMHPSLTRSFRISSSDDPDTAMRSVFEQYAELVEARRSYVAEQNTTDLDVDLRIGWLLWQDSLRQFLYFEEPMSAPSPDDYFAEWKTSGREGSRRKQSKNLWIYEKSTRRKRYSVTTDAGAKIQPYFDVPPPNDPNLYVFTVIGEHIDAGNVRVWLTHRTYTELKRRLGGMDSGLLEETIFAAAEEISTSEPRDYVGSDDEVYELTLSTAAYDALVGAVDGVNDDHRFQLLLDHLRNRD
jgi:hypothetical protein